MRRSRRFKSGVDGDGSGRRPGQSIARTFSSFRSRNYRLFWFGQLLSVTGTWMGRVAQSWLILNLTDSSFALGLVTALQFTPIMIFSLFGGVLADRLPKRGMLVITQAVMAAQALLLAVLVSTGSVQIWHVYVLATVLGLASAFDNPTRQAFVIEMVGPESLANAVALNSSLFNTARIVGPSIGGALIAAFGIAVPFYLNAVSYLAVIGGLLLMRPAELHNVPTPTRGPVLTRMREGISYAARTPSIALVLIMMVFLGTFGYNFNLVLPLIARYVLGTNAFGLGGLLTALGVGSLMAALGMAYVNRPTERIFLVGAIAFTILLGLLGLMQALLPTLILLVLLGVASIAVTATANSRLQLLTPGDYRGRVMSLYIFVSSGTAPIGSLLIGTIAERANVRVAVLITTALGVLLGLLYHSRSRSTVITSTTIDSPSPND